MSKWRNSIVKEMTYNLRLLHWRLWPKYIYVAIIRDHFNYYWRKRGVFIFDFDGFSGDLIASNVLYTRSRTHAAVYGIRLQYSVHTIHAFMINNNNKPPKKQEKKKKSTMRIFIRILYIPLHHDYMDFIRRITCRSRCSFFFSFAANVLLVIDNHWNYNRKCPAKVYVSCQPSYI